MTRILVVEDEAITAQNISRKLKSSGYTVSDVVAFGEEAVEKAKDLQPDLVLMDIGLAGEMDGIEAATQIYRKFNIPVIYLTAYANDDILQRAKTTEPFGYLIKPFETRELCSTVEMALYKHDMEKKLRASEQRYRLLVENLNEGIWEIDSDRNTTFANPRMAEMLGYSVEEMQGRHLFSFMDEAGVEICKYNLERREQGIKEQHDFEFIRKDGARLYASLETAPIVNEQGHFVGAIAGVQDITDRKQAEENLREAEQRYRTVADFTYDLETWESPDGTLRYVSPSCERITGYTVAEFIKNPDLFIDLIVPEDKNIWDEHRRDVMAMPRRHEVQFRIRRRDGQTRWLEQVCQPVIDEQGQFLGYRASNRDISMRKQAEAGLHDSVEKLQIAYKQVTIYAQELKKEITNRRQAQAEIEKLNTQLEQRIADRARELAALYDATAVASASLDLDTMLEQLLKSILLAVRCTSGYIHLLNEIDDPSGKKMLHLAVAQGLSPDEIDPIKTMALEQGLAGWVTRSDELLVVPNVADDPRTLGLKLDKKQGYTGAPIRVSGKVLGALSVFHADKQSISAEEVALLASVADQIGIIVESARLRRQAEQAAVLAERERLARDLHDAVTQSLYSLTLFAETGLKLVETGQVDSQIDLIIQNLTRIREISLQTLKEMRLLIHELKPPDLSRGLAEALHRRLHTVEERAKIKTKLVAADPIDLPLSVEEGFYWIAQEALNNALKHANATEATVYLNTTDGQIELEIVDNGSGFDPNTTDGTGMGLANMRERAERLGGLLSINSNPAKGTRIKIVVSEP